MSQGHHVNVSAVHDLAGTFAGQEQTMRALGGPLDAGAGAVNTGNPALDAETRAVVDQVTELFAGMGGAFGRIAADLRDVATEFQAFDRQVAADATRTVTDGLAGIDHG